jgi:type IV secretion system protein VirD4
MDAAFEYDAETGKIEQVQGETEEKSQTWAGATHTTS